MLPVNTLGASVLQIILFVVPGILGIKCFHITSRRADGLSRLDSIIYSLCLSIFSILLLYFLHSWINFGGLLTVELATRDQIPIDTLPEIVHGYAAIISICVLVGLYLGLVWYHYWTNSDTSIERVSNAIKNRDGKEFSAAVFDDAKSGSGDSRSELWDAISRDIYSDSQVEVVTGVGDHIRGIVEEWGDTIQNRDLLISSPERLWLDDSGEIEQEEEMGDYLYIHDQDISYISLNEDVNRDLDKEVVESFTFEFAPEEVDELLAEMAQFELDDSIEEIDELRIRGVDEITGRDIDEE